MFQGDWIALDPATFVTFNIIKFPKTGREGLCAKWCHSPSLRRLWTIPTVLDIFCLHSPRSATQRLCQKLYRKSRLRSGVSSHHPNMISDIKIVRAHARSQSRLLTQLVSNLTWRGKHVDIHNALDRPWSTTWSRMAPYGAQALNRLNQAMRAAEPI